MQGGRGRTPRVAAVLRIPGSEARVREGREG